MGVDAPRPRSRTRRERGERVGTDEKFRARGERKTRREAVERSKREKREDDREDDGDDGVER